MKHNTIDYFKEISLIPRESGNEKRIADYIVEFAKKRNLKYQRDDYNNVIIKKYVNDKEPIILQSHLDMVCEKENNKEFDFNTDSIEVIEENGYLTANGTTLGADDGIGVAQILNILDSNLDISFEAIFTTNEETTMKGAENIDVSSLKGETMINLDGLDSDSILIESAGFNDMSINMNYSFEEETNNFYKIYLSGLKGGHSGSDINDNRGNSIILLSKLLLEIDDIRISDFIGGTKINVIPSTAEAIINTNLEIKNIVENFKKNEKKNYENLKITLEEINKKRKVLSNNESKRFLNSISSFKHGIFNINNRNEVTTSQNLSIVDLSKNHIRIGARSSIEEQRQVLINYVKEYSKENNYELIFNNSQPGFRTDENSKLVQDLIKAYYEINNKKPVIESVHAAVEVGILKEKIKNLDVAIISPKILDAHSTNERVEIESINKCNEWLLKYFTNKKKESN